MSDLTPGSPAWSRLITASKVAAILGVSPWESPRSIWHKMHGDLPREEATAAQSRGHYLEPAILAWWRDQHGVEVDESSRDLWIEQPTFLHGDWAAATPDAESEVHDQFGEAHRCLVEAKSAASDDDWGAPGTDEIPTYYLVQVMWQMHVSGIHRCYVPIITGRLRFMEYVVDYVPEWGRQLEGRMRAFYDTLAVDTPPDLDDTVATYEAVRKVHPDIEPKAEVEVPPDVAIELLSSAADLDEADARTRKAKSVALDAMGRAQYLTSNGVRIARRQNNKHGISFVPLPKNLPLLLTEDVA